MTGDLNKIIKKYGRKGIIVDTNLLLLWVVGGVEESAIRSFKRTRQFVPEDYRLLDALLARFSPQVCTPNVLTEVSNFIGQLSGELRTRAFRRLADNVVALDERYIASSQLVEDGHFERIGLSDCSIKSVALTGLLVLTDDFKLYGILNSSGVDCINFNHLRPYAWT